VRLCTSSNYGARLVIFDALTYAGNIANIRDVINEEDVVFIHGDIRDPEAVHNVFKRYDINRVVHFAAESHVDRSILGPRTFIETNANGTLNLLLAAGEQWGTDFSDKRFLHVSTDEVFGTLSPTDAPFDEQTAYAPNSPYSASKAASDFLVRSWHHTYGFPTLITNCSNNYGPWQFPEKLIPLMILNAAGNKQLPVYGDGLQVRDWLHVTDHCEAILRILENGIPGETYCIGGNNEQTNIDIVTRVCDLVDDRLGRPSGFSRQLIKHVADRPGHDRRYAINSDKIKCQLGWSPRFDFANALGDVVDWYLEENYWIDSIKSGEYLRFYDKQYTHRLGA
jgi:dTDP-glucose 4,6-dehydratase